MKRKILIHKMFAGFLTLSLLASCNTGNKVVSSFGKRKYTKGYYFNYFNFPSGSKIAASPKNTAPLRKEVHHNLAVENSVTLPVKFTDGGYGNKVPFVNSKQLPASLIVVAQNDFPDTLRKPTIHIMGDVPKKESDEDVRYDRATRRAFWYGILGIALSATVVLGVLFGTLGIVNAIIGFKSKELHKTAWVGLILSILAIFCAVIAVLLFASVI